MERSLVILAAIISLGIVLCAPQRQEGTTSAKHQPVYRNNTRVQVNGTGELFGYPEAPPQVESKQNARNRTPIYIPDRCQKNEILYPGDQDSDWVCDCKATYVYHPPTKQCYQLFTQGYCQDGFMIELKLEAKHPECVRNNCWKPNVSLVWFDGQCVPLNQYHEVCDHHEIQQIVGVKEESNDLGCINISDVTIDNKQTPALPTTRPSNQKRNAALEQVNRNTNQ